MSLHDENNVVVTDENGVTTTYLSKNPPTLKEAYDIIGCNTVELIQCNDGTQILVDENGKLADFYINYEATNHWQQSMKIPLWDMVAGNAIILQGKAVWK